MLGVVRRNPEFRRLWLAQVASSGGDWFSRVAVLSLIAKLSGAEAAVGVGLLYGVELALRLLPTTLLGPIAGPVADRFSRKALMGGADLVRAALVLSLVTVDEAGDLPFLYVVIAVQMGTGIFFESARSGALPGTMPRDDLHAAWALSSATWSTMLAVGSLCGGLLVTAVGIRGVFVIDALTYVASAVLVGRVALPPMPEQREPLRWSEIVFLTDLRRGLAHVRALGLASTVLAKTFWGPAGGYLVLLSVFAQERFGSATDPEAAGLAIGVFYSARGVGTGLGPVVARHFLGSTDRMLRVQIALGYLVGAAGYALLPFARTLPVASLFIVFSHLGGSTIWVGSTTLWQKHVDDAFRGRVFALEFLGMTFAFSLGGVLAGLCYDWTGSASATTWTVCSAVLVLGLAWTALARAGAKPRPAES